jgi:Domain of unknown function (DUF1707)
VPNPNGTSTIIGVAKLLGSTPLRDGGHGATYTTRATDGDRQDACQILDNALNDGEITDQEHRERVRAATKAVTLGDLQALVEDLQADTAGLQLPARAWASRPSKPPAFGGWGGLGAAFVVAVLLGVGIGWGLYGNTRSPLDFTTDPGAKPDGVGPVVLTPPTEPLSVGGLTGLMEQTRKRFGDTMGFRLVIYPTYAVLDRPDHSDDRRMLVYDYRGGWGDPTSSAKSAIDRPVAVDLSKFDIATTVGLVRGAPDNLRMKKSALKTTYVVIEPATDPTLPGALSLSVYVSSDYGGGSIVFAGNGAIEQVNLPS